MSKLPPITDIAPAADLDVPGVLTFWWTRNNQPAPAYQQFTYSNFVGVPQTFRFFIPQDSGVTDWAQAVGYKGGSSKVSGGNIQKRSPWSFYPLTDLTEPPEWRIPDLAPTTDPNLTIYAAVNLDLYFTSNPNGFLNGNWQVGQTLSDLGLHITNGVIPGVDGIQWATTDFTFDENSATGYVPIGGSAALLNSDDFQTTYGDILILAQHEAEVIPEPTTLIIWSLLGTLAIGVGWWRKRQF